MRKWVALCCVLFIAMGTLALRRLKPPLKAPTPEQLQAAFPGDTRKILESSDQFILLSLDPKGFGRTQGKGTFHGYRVLGQTVVSSKVKSELMANFYNAMAAEGAFYAACFSPRHGIHAVRDGKPADLVICFECMQFVVYPNKQPSYALISRSAQPVFDRVLSNAAIPLAH